MNELEMVLRLVLSVILGGLIGLERQLHRRTAGLRTNILVCLGSCLIMVLSLHIYELYRGVAAVDPSRIASGVITGIGFLGAGTIIRERENIKGLTTAACLWVVSAIGLAVGCGFYTAGVVTAALTLMVLFFLRYFERALFDRNPE